MRQKVFEIIKAISGQSAILTIPRMFIDLTGSMKEALFLSQCVYWQERTIRKDGFFYKTYEEWEKELTLSKYDVKRISSMLEERGVLITKLEKAEGRPVLHYKVSQENLVNWISEFLDNQNFRLSKNFTIDSEKISQSMDSEKISQSINIDEIYNREVVGDDNDFSPSAGIDIDELDSKIDDVYRQVTGLITWPGTATSDNRKIIEAALIKNGMSTEAAVADLKPYYETYTNTKSKKTGRQYSRTGMGWLDWYMNGEIPSGPKPKQADNGGWYV